MKHFDSTEAFARRLDEDDPLRSYRARFHLPHGPNGNPIVYFAGNSLGLQPKGVRDLIDQELKDWADLAVDAHFEGRTPWYSYHEVFREVGARLVGGRPGEVVMMNSLTVNLHLMMVSFYRPTAGRYRILVEAPAFPSDTYAVKTHLRYRGHDPKDALVVARPRAGEHLLRQEDVEELIAEQGDTIALVLMSGVNFFTGQLYDMARITAAAHERGCMVGWDLAHAAGNVPLSLHDWDVDFAAWCSYKYLNAGPGAVAGCFVHERHGGNADVPRFAGWWGNDPATRFRMHLEPEFIPRPGADGWQISNPPIFSLAPLRTSLAIFDEVGPRAQRAKSERLTAYLLLLIDELQSGGGGASFEVITPRDPAARGCQLSILAHADAKGLFKSLVAAGIVGDFREPNVIRVAPVPLYNSFMDVWRFAQVLKTGIGER